MRNSPNNSVVLGLAAVLTLSVMVLMPTNAFAIACDSTSEPCCPAASAYSYTPPCGGVSSPAITIAMTGTTAAGIATVDVDFDYDFTGCGTRDIRRCTLLCQGNIASPECAYSCFTNCSSTQLSGVGHYHEQYVESPLSGPACWFARSTIIDVTGNTACNSGSGNPCTMAYCAAGCGTVIATGTTTCAAQN